MTTSFARNGQVVKAVLYFYVTSAKTRMSCGFFVTMTNECHRLVGEKDRLLENLHLPPETKLWEGSVFTGVCQ